MRLVSKLSKVRIMRTVSPASVDAGLSMLQAPVVCGCFRPPLQN